MTQPHLDFGTKTITVNKVSLSLSSFHCLSYQFYIQCIYKRASFSEDNFTTNYSGNHLNGNSQKIHCVIY